MNHNVHKDVAAQYLPKPWLWFINERLKHLFANATSFKNIIGVSTLYLFFKYDHADTWAIVSLVAILLAFREAKEMLAIWVKRGN